MLSCCYAVSAFPFQGVVGLSGSIAFPELPVWGSAQKLLAEALNRATDDLAVMLALAPLSPENMAYSLS
jgi:hypothetical protein